MPEPGRDTRVQCGVRGIGALLVRLWGVAGSRGCATPASSCIEGLHCVMGTMRVPACAVYGRDWAKHFVPTRWTGWDGAMGPHLLELQEVSLPA